MAAMRNAGAVDIAATHEFDLWLVNFAEHLYRELKSIERWPHDHAKLSTVCGDPCSQFRSAMKSAGLPPRGFDWAGISPATMYVSPTTVELAWPDREDKEQIWPIVAATSAA